MHKEVHIIRGLPCEDYKGFKNRVLQLTQEVLSQSSPEKLKVCLTDQRPPRLSIIPFKKKKIAVLSIYGVQASKLKLFTGIEGYSGAYTVEEAIPVSYSKNWKDGEPTPGACLLTLFHRKPRIDEDTFIRRWHEGHTPLSLKLHPLWNYNRNVVKGTLTENSTWYDGIVEEQLRKASDLLNPCVFFGPPLMVPRHMFQVFLDTRSFIDMRRIETYLANEIHVKS